MIQPVRQIVLTVLGPEHRDPMALLRTTPTRRAAESVYSRAFPLRWDPPPDTMFARATKLDLGVFGEDLPAGSLQMIDPSHAVKHLERALGEEAATTAAQLVELSRQTASLAAVVQALETGEWPADLDARGGPIVQAAGFARQLLLAVRAALAEERAVVWEYTGGTPKYSY